MKGIFYAMLLLTTLSQWVLERYATTAASGYVLETGVARMWLMKLMRSMRLKVDEVAEASQRTDVARHVQTRHATSLLQNSQTPLTSKR